MLLQTLNAMLTWFGTSASVFVANVHEYSQNTQSEVVPSIDGISLYGTISLRLSPVFTFSFSSPYHVNGETVHQ